MRKLIKEKKQQPAVFANGILQSAFNRHVDTRLFLIKGHYFIIMPMWIKKSFSWLLEKQKLLLSYLKKNTKITLFHDGCLVNFKINWAI